MKSELGVLTKDQKGSLAALLNGSTNDLLENLEKSFIYEIKFFILSRDRLLKTYAFLMNNTSSDRLKCQIQDLLANISLSNHNMVMVTFIGQENERLTVFSDVDFRLLFGMMDKYNYA